MKRRRKADPKAREKTFGKAARKKRRNPLLLTLHNPSRSKGLSPAAAAAFREFHEVEPRKVRQVDIPGTGDLVALGNLLEVVYRPTRSARSGPPFVHRFGPGAVLAASVDGKQLFLVPAPGKPFRVDWSRGIIG